MRRRGWGHEHTQAGLLPRSGQFPSVPSPGVYPTQLFDGAFERAPSGFEYIFGNSSPSQGITGTMTVAIRDATVPEPGRFSALWRLASLRLPVHS